MISKTNKKKMINLIDKMIEDCLEHYPIPNLFRGLTYKESIKERNDYIKILKKNRKLYEK